MSPSSTSNSDDDGLVCAPPDLTRSGWRRVAALVVVSLFLAITAGPGALDLIAPAPGPALTKTDRAVRNRELAAANVADGSLMRFLDRELQEQSNVRHALVPWYIAYGLLPLQEGGSGVLVGHEGWLFLGGRIQPVGGSYRPEHGALAANVLTAIDRRLAALDIQTVFLLVPRKATVTQAYLPRGADPGPAFEEDILRRLRERDIDHVDLYEVWDGMYPIQVWQRQDTHWGTQGMWHALEASALALDRWVPPEERTSIAELNVPILVDRKLLMTLGIPRDHAVLDTITHESLPGPRIAEASLDTLPTGGPDVYLLGTSFSHPESATRQLSHFVDRAVTNLSEPGAYATVTLAHALTDGRIPAGSQLVLEIPTFQLQGRETYGDGPEELQIATLETLVQAEPPEWHPLRPSLMVKGANRTVLPSMLLATTGDGIAHLELAGRPEGAEGLQVSLNTGDTRFKLSWPPEMEVLRLPIIAAETGSPGLYVQLEGAPADHSIQMRLVTEMDLEGAVMLGKTRVEALTGGWRQDHRIPSGTLGSRHAAVWIDLPPRGVAGTLDVELIREDGPPHAVGSIPMRLGGTALLRLSEPAGNWTAVRVSGSGVPPRRVGDVRIVDLPPR